jgi:hypothetical protein
VRRALAARGADLRGAAVGFATFGFRFAVFVATRVRVAAFFALGFLRAMRFAILRAEDFLATAFFAGDLRAERFFAVRDFAVALFFLVAMNCASDVEPCRGCRGTGESCAARRRGQPGSAGTKRPAV